MSKPEVKIIIPRRPLTAKRFFMELIQLPLRLVQFPFQLILGNLFFPAVLPATIFKPEHIKAEYFIQGARGNVLQTKTYQPAYSDDPKMKIKHVLYFGGNGETLERSNGGLSLMAEEIGLPLTAFNYSVVGYSQLPFYRRFTRSFNQLVEDGVDQVLALLATHPELKLEEIELYGMSLGGGVATAVAYRIARYCKNPNEVPEKINGVNIREKFKKGNEPYLFSERSFSSLSNVVAGWIFGSKAEKRSILGWIGFGLRTLLLSPLLIVYPIMFLAKLDTYQGFQFSRYPKDKKNYAVVRSPKEFRGYGKLSEENQQVYPPRYPHLRREQQKVIPTPDDIVITPFGSLHRSPFVKFSETPTERKSHFFTAFTGGHFYYAPKKEIAGPKVFIHCHPQDMLEGRNPTENGEPENLTQYHKNWLKA